MELENCTFRGGTAVRGTALSLTDCASASLSNVRMEGLTASDKGGAIYGL